MGSFHLDMSPAVQAWILKQHLFFIGSAPLAADGHVNLSPKGGNYFGIVSPTKFWYLDLTGSGVETLSHLNEPGNGRITVMFNAFEGAPKIIRLWGKGEVLEFGTEKFRGFVEEHDIKLIPGVRAIVLVHIHQVGASCGFSVPKYEFQEFRPTLNDFFEKRQASEDAGKKEDGIERYWAYKNALSMDNLPGLQRGYETAQNDAVKPIQKMVGPLAKTPLIPTKKSKKLSARIAEGTGMEGPQLVLLALLGLLGGLAVLSFVAVEMGWFDGFATGGTARTPSGLEFVVGERVGGGGGGGSRGGAVSREL